MSTDSSTENTSRLASIPGVSTLQEALSQSVETITRTARIDISGGGVDEIDPPSSIDGYWDQYKSTGIVRSNINQFVSDVIEPGVRVEAESDTTQAYFMGGEEAPADAPRDGFLAEAFVHAGERHQPFVTGLESVIKNRWVRGTSLVELLKADLEDRESQITGFYEILPETVYPQVYANKNILIDPDPDAPANEDVDVELTKRDEAAAYIQFDDQSILGRRGGSSPFEDRDEVRLSQNDVMKQVLDPDVGGSSMDEQGVFGTSILEAINVDIDEYKTIKRDRHTAIQTKAYGIWLANFSKETYDLGQQIEVVEWDDTSQDNFQADLENLSPADTLFADGPVDLEKFESDVPDLDDTLQHYVDDITAPLPAPKYSVGFEQDINQFVTERQETRYEDLVSQERRYQERKWTSVFREVARRHPDLDAEGVEVKIEPEEDESPVLSLETQTIENLKTYAEALDLLAGPTQGPGMLVEDDTLRELIAQLPDDVGMDVDGDMPADQPPEGEGDATDVTESAQAAFDSMFGVEAMQDIQTGDIVLTPNGPGVVAAKKTSNFQFPTGGGTDEENVRRIDASPGTPAIVVGFVGESGVFREEAIQSAGVESPERIRDLQDEATDGGMVASVDEVGFEETDWAEGWDEFSLMSFFASHGADVDEMADALEDERGFGEEQAEALAADAKDQVLGTERWRRRF